MQQKKVVFGLLGLIAVAAIYYFISLVIQINKKLDSITAFKTQVDRQLAQIGANGFTLSKRDTGKEHFSIRLNDPQKASAYLTHKGFRVTAEEAQEFKGLKLAVNMAYLNDIITFDLYPVTLPEKLHAILAQENDKQLLTQFEEMLRRKTFFAHIDVDPSSSAFKGYVKDINETLKGRHELKFTLLGFHFSGDIKDKKIVKLTQTLQTLYLYIEGMLERTISGLQHDYALTGPTLYDYQEAYTIAQARVNEAPVIELFSEGIFMGTTSSTKKGVAFETFKTKIKKIDLMLEKKPLGMEDVFLEMNISNIDVDMLEAFQKRDLADKKIFDTAAKKIDSHPIHIDIPMLSVEKIRYEGKEMDGFTLHSHIDVKNSFDISRFNTDPTHALSKMDGAIELSLSNELLALLKEKPEILLLYMTYRPKTVSDQNIYNIHLKDGFMQINGKALKRKGKAVTF
jgi:plasmid maintenance system killer protein